MRAVLLKGFGGYDVLKVASLNRPSPKKSEVLVRVKASSVSNFDINIRQGKKSLLNRKPRIPVKNAMGLEFAGVIEDIGEGVTHFTTGDRVYGMLDLWKGDRSHAEYITVPESHVFYIPNGVSFVEAASLPIGMLTSIRALIDLGKVKEQHRVLINGASGGVGIYALQVAKVMKAEVHATCSAAKVDLLKRFSPDQIYAYDQVDLRKNRQPYDVIFDVAAKWNLAQVKQNLTPKGIYISSNPMKDIWGILIASKLTSRKSRYLMVSRSDTFHLKQVNTFLNEYGIKPVYESVYELDAIQEAHLAFDSRKNLGKVMLELP